MFDNVQVESKLNVAGDSMQTLKRYRSKRLSGYLCNVKFTLAIRFSMFRGKTFSLYDTFGRAQTSFIMMQRCRSTWLYCWFKCRSWAIVWERSVPCPVLLWSWTIVWERFGPCLLLLESLHPGYSDRKSMFQTLLGFKQTSETDTKKWRKIWNFSRWDLIWGPSILQASMQPTLLNWFPVYIMIFNHPLVKRTCKWLEHQMDSIT